MVDGPRVLRSRCNRVVAPLFFGAYNAYPSLVCLFFGSYNAYPSPVCLFFGSHNAYPSLVCLFVGSYNVYPSLVCLFFGSYNAYPSPVCLFFVATKQATVASLLTNQPKLGSLVAHRNVCRQPVHFDFFRRCHTQATSSVPVEYGCFFT